MGQSLADKVADKLAIKLIFNVSIHVRNSVKMFSTIEGVIRSGYQTSYS